MKLRGCDNSRDLLQSALHLVVCGGAQVHKSEASTGPPRGGNSSTHPCMCSRNPGLTAQPLLKTCVIALVREEEVGGEGICDAKLQFSEFFTYFHNID